MGVQRFTIRRIEERDAGAVALLLGELGYPTREDALRTRLSRQGDQAEIVLVVQVEDKVVGCLSLLFATYFPDGSTFARVTALVVDGRCRGQGLGAALVEAAAEEGRRRGCSALEVTTAERRADAHRFYEGIGFTRTSLRFLRRL